MITHMALALIITGQCPELEEQLRTVTEIRRQDRRHAQEAILTWKAIAGERKAALEGALDKLATRTPTVSVTLTQAPPLVAPEPQDSTWKILGAAGAGVALGVLLTLLATK